VPEYAVKSTAYVQPVESVREAIDEVDEQLAIASGETNISRWRVNRKTSELAGEIGIVDVVVFVGAEDQEDAEEQVEQQFAYISDTKVTGWEVVGARKASKPRASSHRRPDVRVRSHPRRKK